MNNRRENNQVIAYTNEIKIGLKLSSMIQTLKYHTLIETCKNVGLNVKEYFTYVFSRLIEGEKDYEKLLPSAVAR